MGREKHFEDYSTDYLPFDFGRLANFSTEDTSITIRDNYGRTFMIVGKIIPMRLHGYSG